MAEIVEGVHYLSVADLTEINRLLIELQTPDEPVGVLSVDNL
ncbi:type II toxin-antitoxin system death-on-curing family toxin, partial [Escherichia coli]